MREDDHSQLFLFLGRLEGKVDTLLKIQSAEEKRLSALEGRVQSLERRLSYALGAAALLGTLLHVALHDGIPFLQ